jgi:threonyl-tRNA synthetase
MEANDHRQLARRLDIYHIEEDAPGMVYWHGPGWQLYRLLENYIRARMQRLGYEEVRTPVLLPRALWERSGHWERFGENMFISSRGEGREMALKPMSCPCHLQIFNAEMRSWRDLPMRISEFGICHRDEPSGSMHGLMRTRGFEQDDAHVLCREEHVVPEVKRFVGLLSDVYAALGFPRYRVGLSLRPEARAGSDADWDRAEALLAEAARAAGLDPVIQPGEGAFYGPKLEFALKDRQGRVWQCGTIQLDLVLPGRLGATYVDEHGERAVPIMLHHAVFGSMGRFLGMLLEERAGRLPFWLAPVQVAVLPVGEAQVEAARGFRDLLAERGVRARLFAQAETLSRRIVMCREALIPARAVIGHREAAGGTVALEWKERREILQREAAVDLLSSEGAMPA